MIDSNPNSNWTFKGTSVLGMAGLYRMTKKKIMNKLEEATPQALEISPK